MKETALKMIRDELRMVRNNMLTALTESGESWDIQDEELADMYRKLLDMCVMLGRKIKIEEEELRKNADQERNKG